MCSFYFELKTDFVLNIFKLNLYKCPVPPTRVPRIPGPGIGLGIGPAGSGSRNSICFEMFVFLEKVLGFRMLNRTCFPTRNPKTKNGKLKTKTKIFKILGVEIPPGGRFFFTHGRRGLTVSSAPVREQKIRKTTYGVRDSSPPPPPPQKKKKKKKKNIYIYIYKTYLKVFCL